MSKYKLSFTTYVHACIKKEHEAWRCVDETLIFSSHRYCAKNSSSSSRPSSLTSPTSLRVNEVAVISSPRAHSKESENVKLYICGAAASAAVGRDQKQPLFQYFCTCRRTLFSFGTVGGSQLQRHHGDKPTDRPWRQDRPWTNVAGSGSYMQLSHHVKSGLNAIGPLPTTIPNSGPSP